MGTEMTQQEIDEYNDEWIRTGYPFSAIDCEDFVGPYSEEDIVGHNEWLDMYYDETKKETILDKVLSILPSLLNGLVYLITMGLIKLFLHS